MHARMTLDPKNQILFLSSFKARIGHNPKSGEKIKIAAKTVVKFRVAKAAKDSLLAGK